jgi:hypothetical protein
LGWLRGRTGIVFLKVIEIVSAAFLSVRRVSGECENFLGDFSGYVFSRM